MSYTEFKKIIENVKKVDKNLYDNIEVRKFYLEIDKNPKEVQLFGVGNLLGISKQRVHK